MNRKKKKEEDTAVTVSNRTHLESLKVLRTQEEHVKKRILIELTYASILADDINYCSLSWNDGKDSTHPKYTLYINYTVDGLEKYFTREISGKYKESEIESLKHDFKIVQQLIREHSDLNINKSAIFATLTAIDESNKAQL